MKSITAHRALIMHTSTLLHDNEPTVTVTNYPIIVNKSLLHVYVTWAITVNTSTGSTVSAARQYTSIDYGFYLEIMTHSKNFKDHDSQLYTLKNKVSKIFCSL